MILVLMIVVILMLVVAINNHNLNEKLAYYQEKEKILKEQIEAEEKRAEEIKEFKKYTETKKYIEDIAREKLGLVYEDEVIIHTEDN